MSILGIVDKLLDIARNPLKDLLDPKRRLDRQMDNLKEQRDELLVKTSSQIAGQNTDDELALGAVVRDIGRLRQKIGNIS